VGARFDKIITVEDGALRGGVGEAITKSLADNNLCKRVRSLGIADNFVEQGTPAELYSLCGYDSEGIFRAIIEKN
ncbi:MAG: 1-deoxy-D-xylulose-5-phosphate synthase, partial [Alistipes sp.]|nr:1-deoxy-D-xylulose-5-phosphate synthase [Alistipes sp.]